MKKYLHSYQHKKGSVVPWLLKYSLQPKQGKGPPSSSSGFLGLSGIAWWVELCQGLALTLLRLTDATRNQDKKKLIIITGLLLFVDVVPRVR